jgi:hypothetical protein
LGFFWLSSEKSQPIQLNGVLWKLALPKPKPRIGKDKKARLEVLLVLPAALPLTAESFFKLAHFVLSIYSRLPPHR